MRAFLSLASAGDMEFRYGKDNARRTAFLGEAGISGERLVGIELAHSRSVLYAEKQKDVLWRKADGLFTRSEGACLAVTVADCMPIFFHDRSTGAFGVLHSGWKGTGIALVALRALRARYGSRAQDVAFILGPHIGPCCYEVEAERAVQFMEEQGPEAAECREGRWYLDLGAANEALLRRSGVQDIARERSCTACDRRLGSFRRQGKAGFTRMMAGLAHF